MKQFETAIELSRELAEPEFELKCLRQLSVSYFELEKLKGFLELNEKALQIARSLKHRREEARCLNNIGLYFFRANRYSKALALYNDALVILRGTVDSEEDRANCVNNIALIHLSLGDYDKALSYLQEAISIDRMQKNGRGLCMGLNNIGEVLRNSAPSNGSIGLYSKAIDYFLRAVKESRAAKDKRIEIYSLNNLGLSYSSLAQYSTALRYFRLALDEATSTGRTGDTGAIACNIGQTHLQMGNISLAKLFFTRSIELALKMNRDEVLWETYFGLGRCFEAERETASALTCYEKAADIIDTIRRQLSWDDQKTGFARDKWKVYEAWVELLFQKNRVESRANAETEILRIVERAKARALIEGLSRAENAGPQSVDPDRLRARKLLTRNISLMISELARHGVESERRKNLLENLARAEDEYTFLADRERTDKDAVPSPLPRPISIEEVQRGLVDAETAIVEFFLGEKRSYVFLITRNEVTLELLPPRTAIEDSLRAYLKIISTPPKAGFQGDKAGRRIYEQLFSALEPKLGPRIQNLIVVPDGVLCYLPFETLVRGGDNGGPGKFMVESFRVSYAPSISSLAVLVQRNNAGTPRGRILAMGDPIYTSGKSTGGSIHNAYGDVLREIYQDNGFDFSPLPFSKTEVLQIAEVFPEKTVDAYLGSNAREEVVKSISLTNYGIIHFACHGFLDENAPQRSALVLSLDDDLEEDGFLQAREIYELRLNADLVVLSACQTGRGRLENGEGILGLPRMFLYAGAQSTISSLWKISDRSTSSLMKDFYRLLAAGCGKAQALREAKVRMLRSKLAHPFYWAGFILHGDYRSSLDRRLFIR